MNLVTTWPPIIVTQFNTPKVVDLLSQLAGKYRVSGVDVSAKSIQLLELDGCKIPANVVPAALIVLGVKPPGLCFLKRNPIHFYSVVSVLVNYLLLCFTILLHYCKLL